jgi:hypothetical protein
MRHEHSGVKLFAQTVYAWTMADAKDLRDYRRKAKEQRVSEEREAWLAGVLSWLPRLES